MFHGTGEYKIVEHNTLSCGIIDRKPLQFKSFLATTCKVKLSCGRLSPSTVGPHQFSLQRNLLSLDNPSDEGILGAVMHGGCGGVDREH
jgi:hypothetical protein